MARRARLNAGGPRLRRAAGLLLMFAAVLAGHVLVLAWLAHAHFAEPRLRPLATPLFTRLLQPSAPPAVVAPPPAAAPRPNRPVARQVTPSTPPFTTTTVSAQPPPMPVPEVPSGPGEGHADGSGGGAGAGAPAAEVPENAAAASPEAAAAPGSGPAEGGTAQQSAPPTASAEDAATSAQASPAAPAADSWPADTRLSYALSGRFRSGDLYGSARVQWQREGTRYQTRVEIDLSPFISQVLTSQGQVGSLSLEPEAYEETRRGRSRGVRLAEEWITLNDGQRLARPEGVQDTASQFVELSHRFATGRDRLEVGRSVSLWLVRPGGVDLWTYDIVGTETLRTAQLGAIEAFHLKPRPLARPRGNIVAEMWFAPSLQFLPVRIRVTMGEEAEVDLLVDTIEQR